MNAVIAQRLEEAAEAGIIRIGEVSELHHAHDDWCASNVSHEVDACNCDVWLVIVTRRGQWRHQGDGWVRTGWEG